MSSLAAPAYAQGAATATVRVEIAGLRNGNGVVRLCLTQRHDDFPDCKKPGAISGTVKASKGVTTYEFHNVPLGNWALATFHDENGDAKLNTMLGIPKEGFAFSRNPPLKPRAPRFDESNFQLGTGGAAMRIAMHYML